MFFTHVSHGRSRAPAPPPEHALRLLRFPSLRLSLRLGVLFRFFSWQLALLLGALLPCCWVCSFCYFASLSVSLDVLLVDDQAHHLSLELSLNSSLTSSLRSSARGASAASAVTALLSYARQRRRVRGPRSRRTFSWPRSFVCVALLVSAPAPLSNGHRSRHSCLRGLVQGFFVWSCRLTSTVPAGPLTTFLS